MAERRFVLSEEDIYNDGLLQNHVNCPPIPDKPGRYRSELFYGNRRGNKMRKAERTLAEFATVQRVRIALRAERMKAKAALSD